MQQLVTLDSSVLVCCRRQFKVLYPSNSSWIVKQSRWSQLWEIGIHVIICFQIVMRLFKHRLLTEAYKREWAFCLIWSSMCDGGMRLAFNFQPNLVLSRKIASNYVQNFISFINIPHIMWIHELILYLWITKCTI